MNEGDNRLLLLAAVSQRAQRAQSEQMGTPPPEEEESSTALISKDSPCISDVTAADDASKNTAVSDGRAVALLSPKQHDMLPQAITTNTGSAGPTTFTLNGNEDIMKGLYQVKIPTLYSPKEPRPPMTQNKKRKVSDGTRDAMMLMYGGRLHAPSEIVKSTPASFSAVPAPPLGMNGGGYHQDSNAVVGGAAASTPMLGHNYHQQIMAMSVAGLSAPNMMSMVQGRPQPQQMQKMIQHQQKAKMQTVIPSDEGPLKKKKKRKKKDVTTRRAATTARDVPKYTTTTKDGKPIVFPNQDIYSQMLQMKTLKSSPQEAEALAAQIAPFYSRWRKDEASSSMAAAAPSSSQWNPSFSVQTTGEKSMHHHQEDPLKIQSRFLEMEMSLTREHQQKQLQKYILEQQNRQRRTKDVSLEQLMAPKLMMQQQQHHHHQPIGNNHLSLPPISIPMAQQDPTLLPQNNAHLQVVLRELENQVRAEEHDRILQSNQRRAVELRCHQAVLLEEQMKLREMEIMRERNRLVDLQTVNRLRLQADVLEDQLMM